MNLQHIIVYILAAVTLATAIIYFILAYDEYTEFAAGGGEEGLEEEEENELPKLQIEIAFFAGSGIIYLGLLGWILVKKLKSILPYIILIVISIILIVTYAASRTVGVPIIGVEHEIGNYDIISKVFQGIIIAISGYLIYRTMTNRRKQDTIKRKK